MKYEWSAIHKSEMKTQSLTKPSHSSLNRYYNQKLLIANLTFRILCRPKPIRVTSKANI